MVATGKPLDEILDTLMLFLEAQEPGMRCGTLIVTDDGAHFRRGSGPHLPDAYHHALDGVSIKPPYVGSCGEAAQQGTAVVIPDIAEDTRYAEEWRSLMLSCGLQAVRSTPVCGPDGRALASIAMYFDHPRDPNPADPELVEMATHLASIALEHDRAATALHRQNDRFETLNRIAKTLSSDLDLERIVQSVVESATALSGAKFGAFFYNVTDGQGERYVLYTLSGAPRSAFENFGLPRNTAIFERTFRGTGILRSDDIRDDPRYGRSAPHFGMPQGHLPVASYLAVPVVSRTGEVHGGLFFGHDQTGVFTQEAEDIVAGIAAHAALAIDNARLLQTAQTEIEHRRRAEALQAAQKRALELTVENAPLSRVLDTLARTVEAQSPSGMVGSILLADGDGHHLRHGAAPGLPKEYNAAIDGIEIGPAAGSCGTAAYTRKPVYVSDIAVDPLWADFRDLALAHDLRACWSTPIMSAAGAVLGTFAMYYHEPREPNAADLELVDIATRTAALVIERKRAEGALRQSEERLRTVIASSPLAVLTIDADARVHLWNRAAEELFGWTEAEVLGKAVPFIPEGRLAECVSCRETAMRGEVFAIETQRLRRDGTLVDVSLSAAPLSDAQGEITEILVLIENITARKRHEEHQRLLLNELNHRVKNTLATVQSMAMQTLRNSVDTEQARGQIEARLIALSKAHDILTRENWEGASLRQVIEEAVVPYCDQDRDRFEVEGPNVWVSPKYALALAMALHELCTNAVKYGALSNDAGHVRISWAVAGLNGARELRMQWIELGGPPVTPPSRRGFGSRLVERGLKQDLGGDVRIEFAPAGVNCIIAAPLEHAGAGATDFTPELQGDRAGARP